MVCKTKLTKAWYGFIKANHIAEHSGFDITIVDNLKQILQLSCDIEIPIPKKEAQKIIERLLEFNETRLPELMKLIENNTTKTKGVRRA